MSSLQPISITILDKEYKVGQELECIVLDCDTEKKILDLSERLADVSLPKEKVDKNDV